MHAWPTGTIDLSVEKLYPSLTEDHKERLKNALCPFKVELPTSVKEQIFKITDQFIQSKKLISKKWQDSVLNCLDFHYSENTLKIIEANTNASGYLITHLLEDDKSLIESYEQKLLSSFYKVFNTKNPSPLFIVDTDPEKEKMYPEFLMFKEMFLRQNISKVEIINTKALEDRLEKMNEEKIYVYNRDTDFYLEKFPALKGAWLKKSVQLSTSPKAYENIASKNEPILTDRPEDFPELEAAVLKTHPFSSDLWEIRKKLFFKPKESFGSKGVYAGKSLSRKKFDSLNEETYLAQELHLPGKIKHNEEDWKFDIRAYFSEDSADLKKTSVQKIVARVYQGQVTNFSKLGGGFALIEWV